MASLAEVKTIITDYLGFHSNLSDTILNRHLNLYQEVLETTPHEFPTPWFLFDSAPTEVTVADTATIALPARFIDWEEEWPPYVITSASVESELCRLDFRHAKEVYAGRTGKPVYFAQMGTGTITLFPTPDAVYTITLPCYRRSATTLSDGGGTSWLTEFPNLIAMGAAYMLALSLRDENVTQMLKNDLQKEKMNYLRKVEDHRHSLQFYHIGPR